MFSAELYEKIATELQCEVAAIKAVAEVESDGRCFTPKGRLMCLFEGHVFSRLTNRKYDKSHPTLSYRKWVKTFYKRSYDDEYTERFSKAFALDPDAAMQSTSWGGFQIMGFHYKDLGFKNVGEMVDFLKESADNHLIAFARYIKAKPYINRALRNKDWAQFAKFYNGQGYKLNRYDSKLEAAYAKYSKNA